ncbi:HipA domain-containing protein [Rubrivirga sp. S365]|uniref:type II toxin-antitoxin system HipA family toxin n=1 Tax=Rubrivirga sp. S365 TaxID=3076080 RepID=UPI0028C6F76A|nr:HipA domain-containing protein [Rubrivirga sp. S365]MDT7858324.1 HipA domain-containing protein [Rubrivirga sp. S365]
MNDALGRCPLTYGPLGSGESLYSAAGLRRLSRTLTHLDPLPFTAARLVQEAAARADRMSIGGVQPKVSAVLRPAEGRFEVVTVGGRWILKPDNPAYPEVPANEDLAMRLASAAGVETADHALVYARGDDDPDAPGALVYAVRRFDRVGRGDKLALEDFGQLLGLDRETKYDASMERAAAAVEAFCTFPAVEKVRLFRRTLVAFLTGNEDMHLKNLAVLTGRDGLRRLSPAYDLVASAAVLRDPQELALPVAGKRSNLRREHLVDYYGRERLGLTERVVEGVLADLADIGPAWNDLIDRCFLSDAIRDRLSETLSERRRRLGLVGLMTR